MRLFDGNRFNEISRTRCPMERFELWWTLLETAIQTPSPHNVQPWRIRLVSEQEAELYIDRNRTLPKEDTTGSFILSAMFIRAFVDETRLDLSRYQFDLIVGGEGLSEGLRSHLRQYARTVISSFGASDLEINIAVETELTIALRRLCLKNGALSKQLFGRDTPPMIFQYNPLDYTIETNAENELLFTIGRQSGAAPKIRYNLRDADGVFTFCSLSPVLKNNGISLSALVTRHSSLPLLFVYGRNDATVASYGAKIYPADLERVIDEDPVLAAEIHSFQLKVIEDDQLKNKLQIHLELSKNRGDGLRSEIENLQEVMVSGLIRVNQDFREVTKMFDRSQVQVFLYEYEDGPFAGRDVRIKNKYIA
jgi:phenylacetate-CoA ligase